MLPEILSIHHKIFRIYLLRSLNLGLIQISWSQGNSPFRFQKLRRVNIVKLCQFLYLFHSKLILHNINLEINEQSFNILNENLSKFGHFPLTMHNKLSLLVKTLLIFQRMISKNIHKRNQFIHNIEFLLLRLLLLSLNFQLMEL